MGERERKMKDIIIAYPNKEVALRLRALLVGEGFRVSHICALGSSALGAAGEKDAGVIICASLLRDIDRKSTRLNSSHPSSSRMPSSA